MTAGENRRLALVLVAVVVVATAIRVLAATNELWFDEIWSVVFARGVSGPAGVFTAIHHDNNHYLNTLYLYFIPDSTDWIVYRIPSILAGVGSVVLAPFLMAPPFGASHLRSEFSPSTFRSPRQGLAQLSASILVATSYLLVLYSSEARGYALAVFFAFAALFAAQRFTATRRVSWGAGVAVSSTLGFLSQLTYVQAYAALVVWTVYVWYRQRRAWRVTARDLAICHLLPALVVAGLYVVDVRRMTIGGGPQYLYRDVVAGTLSLMLGGPQAGLWSAAVAVLALGAAIAAIVLMRRSGSDLWVLAAVGGLASPALMLAIARPTVLYERYFLVAASLLLLSLVWVIDAGARRAPRLAYALLALFVAANSVHTARLIARGRGSYLPALQWMAEHSRGSVATVGSDSDLRNSLMVAFYRRFVPGGVPIVYVPEGRWPHGGPEWVLVHSQAPRFEPPTTIPDAYGHRYDLTNVYRYAEISGWNWALYHNAAP